MNDALFSVGVLVLRVAFGASMLFAHGLPKMKTIIEGKASSFLDPVGLGSVFSLYLATFAELVCAAAIIVGLYTRFAAVILAVNMAVAVYFLYTQNPQWSNLELAFLYLLGFAVIAITGAGNASVDKLIGWKF